MSESEGLSPARISRSHPNRPFSAGAPVHALAPPPKGFEQVRSEAAQPCGSSQRWEPSPTDQKGTPWDSQCTSTAPALTDHTLESPEEDVGRAESPAGGAVVDPHWGCTKCSHGPALSRTPLSHTHTQHWNEGSLTGIFLSCTGANNLSTPSQGIDQGNENMPWPLTCFRIAHSTTVWAAVWT